MGKRRVLSKYYTGDGGNATAGNVYGGGGGGKFSVFEFADADVQVESESRKTLAKFGRKSPCKKSAHHLQPVDKYRFLECFASDTGISQNEFLQSAEYSSCGAISPAQGRRDPGYHTADQKHNKVLYVYSDEDECMEMKSPTSSNLADHEGSIEEQSSDSGKCSKNNDCEAVVVVYPRYVKHENKYLIRCLLTFSRSCIRLEGSLLGDRNRSYRFEWSNLVILKIECQQCESVEADVVNVVLRSMEMNSAETASWNSGCEELEFIIDNDPHWSKNQEEIKSLDLQYKSAWKTITSVCSINEAFEDIIYPEGDPDAVCISRGDIELLQPKTFINDTLVDFYIKYLQTKIKPEDQHRFYFFNTFFFRKFVDMDQGQYRFDEGEAFQRVRKWTRNVKLFEKDYIFMPINYSLHWSMIVICHPGKVADIRDDSMNNSYKVPFILHMDSIRGSHRSLENLIKRYLWEEWKERWNKHEDQIAKKFQNIDFVEPQVPQQENFYDCGLFLLHYVELILEKTSSTDTPAFDFLNKDWFHPAEVSLKKRDQIRNLIYRIVDNNALKHPPGTCDGKYPHTIINEADGSAESSQENGVEESCLGNKFPSPDGVQEFKGQQRNINFLSDESCQPQRPLVPINEANMWLPTEEERVEMQNTSLPQEATMRCESSEDDEPMPPSWLLSGFMTGETKVSQGPSEGWCGESPVSAYVVQPENENHAPKVAASCSAEAEKERYEISSSSNDEDLTTCIVVDSEDESMTESSLKD